MIIQRKMLIEFCDKFLNNEIDKNDIAVFASNLIFSDDVEWIEHDDVLSKTIFEWDNEDINYPITHLNMGLWKKRLLNNVDELDAHNFWDYHIEDQKRICAQYNSKWRPINKKLKIYMSTDLELNPLQGLRNKADIGTTGWYLSTGTNEDLLVPILAEQLLQIRPEIIKYLGLEEGFRFTIDKECQEKVWIG